jgi:hypothetical protein
LDGTILYFSLFSFGIFAIVAAFLNLIYALILYCILFYHVDSSFCFVPIMLI